MQPIGIEIVNGQEQTVYAATLLADAKEYRDAIKAAYMYQYHRNEPHWRKVHTIADHLREKHGEATFTRLEAIAVSFT